MLINSFGHGIVPPEWKVIETIPPGFSRIYYIHDGETTYHDQKGDYLLKKGFIYIFPSSSSFTITHNPSNPLVCTHLHLDLFPFLLHHLVELEVTSESILEKLFQTIIEAIQSNHHALLPLLAEVFETYCKEHSLFLLPNPEITTVFTYIEKNLSKSEITVNELSKLLGYNPQYFIRQFHEIVGLPPYQYIIQYRMKESLKLLKQSKHTISEIALLVGYPDLKSFSRAFKNKYGITPSQFRRCDIQFP